MKTHPNINYPMLVLTLMVMGFVFAIGKTVELNSAPPSSEWKAAPPVPLEMNLFGERYNPTNTPVIIDKQFNIYVYGKWVADTNGLRP